MLRYGPRSLVEAVALQHLSSLCGASVTAHMLTVVAELRVMPSSNFMCASSSTLASFPSVSAPLHHPPLEELSTTACAGV